MRKICKQCGMGVVKEENNELKKEYPFFCPGCDENMYSFECEDVPENIDERKKKIIRYLLEEDYLPINADFIRGKEGMLEAVKELLQEGTIRMRDCNGSAVELNAVD